MWTKYSAHIHWNTGLYFIISVWCPCSQHVYDSQGEAAWNPLHYHTVSKGLNSDHQAWTASLLSEKPWNRLKIICIWLGPKGENKNKITLPRPSRWGLLEKMLDEISCTLLQIYTFFLTSKTYKNVISTCCVCTILKSFHTSLFGTQHMIRNK